MMRTYLTSVTISSRLNGSGSEQRLKNTIRASDRRHAATRAFYDALRSRPFSSPARITITVMEKIR